MADYIVTSGELTTVANAIRVKNGTSSNLSWPDGFVSGISSGSGGGGSSDFSTAKVTIVSNVGGIVYLPATVDEGGESALVCYGLTNAGDYDIVLYKGLCVGSVTVSEQNTVTTTGDIENDSGTLLVTGDCTITIS